MVQLEHLDGTETFLWLFSRVRMFGFGCWADAGAVISDATKPSKMFRLVRMARSQ